MSKAVTAVTLRNKTTTSVTSIAVAVDRVRLLVIEEGVVSEYALHHPRALHDGLELKATRTALDIPRLHVVFNVTQIYTFHRFPLPGKKLDLMAKGT